MGKRGQVAESSTLRTEVNGRGPVTLVWGPFSAVTKLFLQQLRGGGWSAHICFHLCNIQGYLHPRLRKGNEKLNLFPIYWNFIVFSQHIFSRSWEALVSIDSIRQKEECIRKVQKQNILFVCPWAMGLHQAGKCPRNAQGIRYRRRTRIKSPAQ